MNPSRQENGGFAHNLRRLTALGAVLTTSLVAGTPEAVADTTSTNHVAQSVALHLHAPKAPDSGEYVPEPFSPPGIIADILVVAGAIYIASYKHRHPR